jgi:hypothetical protein
MWNDESKLRQIPRKLGGKTTVKSDFSRILGYQSVGIGLTLMANSRDVWSLVLKERSNHKLDFLGPSLLWACQA